jgi:serine/threonine protein kinase
MLVPSRLPQEVTVMCMRGPSMAPGFASNVFGFTLRRVQKRLQKYVIDSISFPVCYTNETQTFCQEAVVWKRLNHPNIVPLLGITITPFQLISNWISGGDLLDYIKKNPDADRLNLVRLPAVAPITRLASLPAIRHCRGPSLPALPQCHPWGPQGRTWLL